MIIWGRQLHKAWLIFQCLLTSVDKLHIKVIDMIDVYKYYYFSAVQSPTWRSRFAPDLTGVRACFRDEPPSAQTSLGLRTLVNAPRFARNTKISRDLRIESLNDFVKCLSTNLFVRTDGSHPLHLRELAPCYWRPTDWYCHETSSPWQTPSEQSLTPDLVLTDGLSSGSISLGPRPL